MMKSELRLRLRLQSYRLRLTHSTKYIPLTDCIFLANGVMIESDSTEILLFYVFAA